MAETAATTTRVTALDSSIAYSPATRTASGMGSVLPGGSQVRPRQVLLYEAARAQLVAEVIEPALEAGETVLCDRFFDSSTAYQGHARGLPLARIETLNRIATGDLSPDRTLLLDIDAALGVQRATCEGADRLECEDVAFHERVRAGFLRIAAENPERVRVIDASGDVETVAARIAEAITDILPLSSAGADAPA